MQYLAHSPRPNRGIPAQTYETHVGNVLRAAVEHASAATAFSPWGNLLVDTVSLAAEFHDLGKLDPQNQRLLLRGSRQGLPVNHVDAGVAHLLGLQPRTLATQLAAVLVYSHHIGLPAMAEHRTRQPGTPFRDLDQLDQDNSVAKHTEQFLSQYLSIHRQWFSKARQEHMFPTVSPAALNSLFRFALSCLVDADHGDTAANYGEAPQLDPIGLCAGKRLESLDNYVAILAKSGESQRNQLRDSLYQACRNSDTKPGIVYCDSPVGTGKTTAVMAHLLRVAAENNLRRVFVVLPFTNIIDQSVQRYRESLTFNGESPDSVVAAHHHRADFENLETRAYAYQWLSPIVVTTAVQFFETLAANRTASLRKLHQLAGSAIFIDEAHSALPTAFWPQAWQWLETLRDHWGCHIVLGSGSLQKFWTLPDIVPHQPKIGAIGSEYDQSRNVQYERQRIRYMAHPERLTLDELPAFLEKQPGPRLLIVNTVQSAAAIARHLAERFGGEHVEHLSTALTPQDRKATLELVKLRLRQPNHRNWTLVATSCVEAGVDVSFRTGFRERCSITSLLQTAGRVNRSGEYPAAQVWDIQFHYDDRLRPHPAFEDSAEVVGELFSENRVSIDICTEAMRREINRGGLRDLAIQILNAESKQDFVEVGGLFRVINSPTITVVIDRDLQELIEKYEKIRFVELQEKSVQIYSNKLLEWAVAPFDNRPELYRWTLRYDSFLGYMAGVLDTVEACQSGGFIL